MLDSESTADDRCFHPPPPPSVTRFTVPILWGHDPRRGAVQAPDGVRLSWRYVTGLAAAGVSDSVCKSNRCPIPGADTHRERSGGEAIHRQLILEIYRNPSLLDSHLREAPSH